MGVVDWLLPPEQRRVALLGTGVRGSPYFYLLRGGAWVLGLCSWGWRTVLSRGHPWVTLDSRILHKVGRGGGAFKSRCLVGWRVFASGSEVGSSLIYLVPTRTEGGVCRKRGARKRPRCYRGHGDRLKNRAYHSKLGLFSRSRRRKGGRGCLHPLSPRPGPRSGGSLYPPSCSLWHRVCFLPVLLGKARKG